MPEPYRSPDWDLVPAKPAQGLNTNNNNNNNTLPTLNKVIIKCTVHYIVHLQCTFSLPGTYESKGFWRFSVGTRAKEDQSSTGHVWPAGFHHVTARSRLERALKLMNRLFI
jgi:hypothetical protein